MNVEYESNNLSHDNGISKLSQVHDTPANNTHNVDRNDETLRHVVTTTADSSNSVQPKTEVLATYIEIPSTGYSALQDISNVQTCRQTSSESVSTVQSKFIVPDNSTTNVASTFVELSAEPENHTINTKEVADKIEKLQVQQAHKNCSNPQKVYMTMEDYNVTHCSPFHVTKT